MGTYGSDECRESKRNLMVIFILWLNGEMNAGRGGTKQRTKLGGTEENYEHLYYLVEPRTAKCIVIREVLTCLHCLWPMFNWKWNYDKYEKSVKHYKFPVVIIIKRIIITFPCGGGLEYLHYTRSSVRARRPCKQMTVLGV
jgi:hypothetical protein